MLSSYVLLTFFIVFLIVMMIVIHVHKIIDIVITA